jgi:hypothetical protein
MRTTVSKNRDRSAKKCGKENKRPRGHAGAGGPAHSFPPISFILAGTLFFDARNLAKTGQTSNQEEPTFQGETANPRKRGVSKSSEGKKWREEKNLSGN